MYSTLMKRLTDQRSKEILSPISPDKGTAVDHLIGTTGRLGYERQWNLVTRERRARE